MPDIFWDISDVGAEYPDSGRAVGEKALIQITEGCAVSGHTELPFSPEFTDGIIDLERLGPTMTLGALLSDVPLPR